MHPAPSRSTVRYIVIDRAMIAFLRFTLEAYEGIASVTTVDAALGLVRVSMAPGCEDDVDRILRAESERLRWRAVEVVDQGTDDGQRGVTV
jgi:hypothetical protein